MSTPVALAEGLRKGDRRALAQAITLAESALPEHQRDARELLSLLASNEPTSFRIGITGPPGAGKSTLIEALGSRITDQDHRLAVLTVDPSSLISGGSILGDKTRMPLLSANEKAFVRPSPSSGIEGGVARYTREAIALCEASGFDRVIVETVGVGQSELRVAEMTDIFVLMLVPAAGDELQGIKRGVMELADIILINKSDGDLKAQAQRSASECLAATGLMPSRTPGWTVPVLAISALDETGLDEVLGEIERFREYLLVQKLFGRRRKTQDLSALTDALREGLLDQLKADAELATQLDEMAQQAGAGRITPRIAADELLERFFRKTGGVE